MKQMIFAIQGILYLWQIHRMQAQELVRSFFARYGNAQDIMKYETKEIDFSRIAFVRYEKAKDAKEARRRLQGI